MRITLLGTGTPILDGRSHGSATLVEVGAARLLVDAGRGATTQLAAAGLHPNHLDAILITHHHHDHISSLGELLLTAWHNGHKGPLSVYGPPGTHAIVTALIEHVFARDIAFTRFTEPDMTDIRQVVQAQDLSVGVVCAGGGWRVLAETVDHGHSLGLSQKEWPCLGYRFEEGKRVFAISGDTVECSGLDRLADHADLLLQCCYLAEAETVTPARRLLADHVIASSGQVGKIASRNRVKRLVLTHIRPKAQQLLESLLEDVRSDYDGEITLGRDLMMFEV